MNKDGEDITIHGKMEEDSFFRRVIPGGGVQDGRVMDINAGNYIQGNGLNILKSATNHAENTTKAEKDHRKFKFNRDGTFGPLHPSKAGDYLTFNLLIF